MLLFELFKGADAHSINVGIFKVVGGRKKSDMNTFLWKRNLKKILVLA